MYIKVLQIAVPFVWFGAVMAISFMEAPLKFLAPGITLPLGLGIGRLVLFALNKIEIVLGLWMLVSLLMLRPSRRLIVYVFSVIAGILLLETAWLLPVLDARAEEVIKGTAEPYSNTHVIYIVFDAVKVVLLFALGVIVTKQHLTHEV